jgi:hypothetical protein
MAEDETSQRGNRSPSEEETMNQTLIYSFQQQNGTRGVHFFDGEHCEFVPWNMVIEFCNKMKDRDNPSHIEFEEKLIHSMSNVDPDTEYVLCRQHGEVVSIECYRQMGL